MRTPILRKVASVLEARIRTESETIVSGSLTSFEAYRYATGIAEGIRIALGLIEEAEAQWMKEADEE